MTILEECHQGGRGLRFAQFTLAVYCNSRRKV